MVCNELMDPMKTRGVLVTVHGVGVLIRGPSGVGKSLAALNLMRRGHSLISDDLVEVTLGPAGDICRETCRGRSSHRGDEAWGSLQPELSSSRQWSHHRA